MPIGAICEDTGVIAQRDHGLILLGDEGGRWRLDATHKIKRWIGYRVRISGTRTGFDVLSVDRIERYDASGWMTLPPKPIFARLMAWLRSRLTA